MKRRARCPQIATRRYAALANECAKLRRDVNLISHGGLQWLEDQICYAETPVLAIEHVQAWAAVIQHALATRKKG